MARRINLAGVAPLLLSVFFVLWFWMSDIFYLPQRPTMSLVIFLVGGGFLLWLGRRQTPKHKLAKRGIISVKEFIEQYYNGPHASEDCIALLLKQIGDACLVDPGRLRPDDRFDAELSTNMWWCVSDEWQFLQQAADDNIFRFGVSPEMVDLSSIRTVGDYILTFSKLLQNSKEQTIHDLNAVDSISVEKVEEDTEE